MTEQEWLACIDPRVMLAEMINRISSLSDRRWRLLACAIQRTRPVYVRNEPEFEEVIKVAIEWAETGNKPSANVNNYYVLMESICGGVSCLIDGSRDAEMDRIAADLFREVIGNPFRPIKIRCSRLCDVHNPDWLTPTVLSIAQEIYTTQDYAGMPILADAMEEAGCDTQSILEHLRGNNTHVRGCWALDLILGKE